MIYNGKEPCTTQVHGSFADSFIWKVDRAKPIFLWAEMPYQIPLLQLCLQNTPAEVYTRR